MTFFCREWVLYSCMFVATFWCHAWQMLLLSEAVFVAGIWRTDWTAIPGMKLEIADDWRFLWISHSAVVSLALAIFIIHSNWNWFSYHLLPHALLLITCSQPSVLIGILSKLQGSWEERGYNIILCCLISSGGSVCGRQGGQLQEC